MKVGHETNVPGSSNRAEHGAHNAVRLSYTSMAERTVCDGRATVLQPLIDVAVSNRRAQKSRAQ
jgi:hypothetical protein